MTGLRRHENWGQSHLEDFSLNCLASGLGQLLAQGSEKTIDLSPRQGLSVYLLAAWDDWFPRGSLREHVFMAHTHFKRWRRKEAACISSLPVMTVPGKSLDIICIRFCWSPPQLLLRLPLLQAARGVPFMGHGE